jgi:hypothetical protein
MILGLQIIAILFAFAMIYFAVLHRRRGELNRAEILSWVTIWVATIVIVVFPELLRKFAQAFFITRLFDLMVVGGFVLVIAMVARVYVSTKRMEKKLEDYVRHEALKSIKKKKKK